VPGTITTSLVVDASLSSFASQDVSADPELGSESVGASVKAPMTLHSNYPKSEHVFVIWVSALGGTLDDVNGAFDDLRTRYPVLLATAEPLLELERGRYYLMIGPACLEVETADLCTELRAAGLKECTVVAYLGADVARSSGR
jgi:hypothetical protein